jgi:hypothetical protein
LNLTEAQLVYPDHLAPEDVVRRIGACLEGAEANGDVLLHPGLKWQNFIHRVCFEYGLHPVMPLVALQRERSLLGHEANTRDYDFALGVVGQDAPGTSNERWNGLPNQLFLGIRSMAWLANIGPTSNFGWRPGIAPSKRRWINGASNFVQLFTDACQPGEHHLCADRAEYVQLCYTPHLAVLGTNGAIYDRWLKRHWE